MGISTLRRHHAARAAQAKAAPSRSVVSIDEARAMVRSARGEFEALLIAERAKSAQLKAALEQATAPEVQPHRQLDAEADGSGDSTPSHQRRRR